jgi:peptidyl-prolyl cis-trans isomerase A (cyclophilin A)
MLKGRNFRIFLVIMMLLITVARCRQRAGTPGETSTSAEPAEEMASQWMETLSSLVAINTFDNDRILESGQGFFIDSQLVVTRLSYFREANRALIFPLDEEKGYEVEGYVYLDRISDLILLKVTAISRKPLELYAGVAPNSARSYILSKPAGSPLQLRTGRIEGYSVVEGVPLYQVSNQILRNTFGSPIFVSNRQVIGLGFSEVVDYRQRSLAVPSHIISNLLGKSEETVKPLSATQSQTDRKKSEANSRIRGIHISTDAGDITIRLLNETPVYRDNFIRLAEEGFYDSLLVHRVISGFGIQSGAADTRYAGKDDVVGWKGPGYTLPAHITPGKFHQRGVVGSPRKPDRDNSRRRSDGSQYYIVSGRTYNDIELNDIEKETGHSFTPRQREVYKTIGGAPHLDGSYTIFGEVTSGLDVVDKITKTEVGREFRPVNDIRVRKVSIIR